jgi:hypothetical protein
LSKKILNLKKDIEELQQEIEELKEGPGGAEDFVFNIIFFSLAQKQKFLKK